MNKIVPLFICLANVGRSQIAEGIYNHMHSAESSFSCAGGEARKEKYNGRPAESIIKLMRNQEGIDISHQRVHYLSDLGTKILTRVNKVIFLVENPEDMTCEEECKHEGLTPYEFLRKSGFVISTHKIEDPNLTSQDRWMDIYKTIKAVVEQIQ